LWDNKATLHLTQAIDWLPPSVSFNDLTSSTADQARPRYSFTATDASDISTARVLVDGVPTSYIVSSGPNGDIWVFPPGSTSVSVPSFWIDLHALSDGPHTIALEVTDTWGFVGVATKTFTRERTAPSCTLSAAQDAADWTKIRFTVWAQDLGAGLQTLDFQVDGSTVKSKPMAGFPQTYTWISGTSSLPAGLHKVRAVCTDAQRSYRSERRISASPAGEALALTATLVATDDRGELSVEVLDRAGKPVALAELFATVQDERAAPPSAPPLPPSTRSEPRSPRPRAPPDTAAPTRPRGGRRASGARPSRGAPPTAPRKVRCP
jgi:hypothetical protein